MKHSPQKPGKKFFHLASALLTSTGLLMGMSASHAQTKYDHVYVFGDSLSDTGNVKNATGSTWPVGYASGQWTDNKGNGDWINTFVTVVGGNATPSTSGGDNFAWGGARTGSQASTSVPDLNDQVGAYLTRSGGKASATSLYVLFIGGNDIAAIIGDASASANPNATVTDGIAAGIGSIASQVQNLYAAGARQFLLFNAPDVLPTPRFQSVLNSLPNAVAQAQLTGLGNLITTGWNSKFNQTVLSLQSTLVGETINTVDFYGYGQSVLANMAGAGFDGSLAPCYVSDVQICANPQTRFFWDTFHPNSSAQKQIAALAISAVPLPGAVWLMAIGLLGLFGFTSGPRRRR